MFTCCARLGDANSDKEDLDETEEQDEAPFVPAQELSVRDQRFQCVFFCRRLSDRGVRGAAPLIKRGS